MQWRAKTIFYLAIQSTWCDNIISLYYIHYFTLCCQFKTSTFRLIHLHLLICRRTNERFRWSQKVCQWLWALPPWKEVFSKYLGNLSLLTKNYQWKFNYDTFFEVCTRFSCTLATPLKSTSAQLKCHRQNSSKRNWTEMILSRSRSSACA